MNEKRKRMEERENPWISRLPRASAFANIARVGQNVELHLPARTVEASLTTLSR